MPNDVQAWDEFHPNLQHLILRLTGEQADDQRQIAFGLREIKADGIKILLNGGEINLRGTHHGGDFPLTGYPATDVDSWKKIIQICKDYGLNHIRFHSWCPPDAAFTAADELGFYLQPECGMWNSFTPGNAISKMLELETARIMRAYGNHPSFVLLSPTNEPAGRWQGVLEPWTVNWYKQDPRRLYAENTGRANPRAEGPQYAIVPVRGNRGWFGADYSDSPLLRNVKVPVVSHEVGQWCAYPDFDVIQRIHRVHASGQLRNLPRLGRPARRLGSEQGFLLGIRQVPACLLQGRDRSQPAHARTGRVPVARSARLPWPGHRSCRRGRCLLETQELRHCPRVQPFLRSDRAAGADAQSRIEKLGNV